MTRDTSPMPYASAAPTTRPVATRSKAKTTRKPAASKAAKKTGKAADLAGPGISTYPEVAKILPTGYRALLNNKDTQKAIYEIKRYIEDGLCKELNLQMVQVPLIVDRDSGVNDYLDRDGSRTPVEFR